MSDTVTTGSDVKKETYRERHAHDAQLHAQEQDEHAPHEHESHEHEHHEHEHARHEHHHSRRSRRRKALFCALWILQIVAEAVAAVGVVRLNMLPALLLVLFFAALALLAAVTFCLFFYRKHRHRRRRRMSAANIVGLVLAVLIIIGAAVGTWAVFRLDHSIRRVTTPVSVSHAFGVYVLADDSADKLKDAADYTFGVMDPAHAGAVEEALGAEIKTREYGGILDLVNALLNKDTKAMIMNEAFADLLDDDDYYTFTENTKIIYEFSIDAEPAREDTTGYDIDLANVDVSKSEVTTEPFILYLSGSDTRSQMLTTSRSDVNILVAVNPQTKEIVMINTPRDYYVPISVGNGALDKLTHCGVYGIQCSIDTLSQLYGIDIDYYAQINFAGFEKLVDTIGGVTVYSNVNFTTRHNHVMIQAGYNELNGMEALSFARERYALAGGDNDRGKNQMKIITAVIEKLSAGKVIAKYSEILHSLEGMFITNVSSEEISAMVKMQLTDNASWSVHSYAVVGTGGSNTTYSMPGQKLYVMYPNEASVSHATALLQRVLAGEKLTDADMTLS